MNSQYDQSKAGQPKTQAVELDESQLDTVHGGISDGTSNTVAISDGTSNISDGTSNRVIKKRPG